MPGEPHMNSRRRIVPIGVNDRSNLFGKLFRIAKAGLDQENSCVSSEESVGRKWIILRFFAVKPRPVWGNQSGHDRREIRLFDRGSFAGEMIERPYASGGTHIEIPTSVRREAFLRVGRPQRLWRIAIYCVANYCVDASPN